MSTEQPPDATTADETPAAETAPPETPAADAAPEPAPAAEAAEPEPAEPPAAEADIAAAAAQEAPPVVPPTMPTGRVMATGKRKSSIARVILEPGDGTITCNGRPLEDLLGRRSLVQIARKPLATAALENNFSIQANVRGGGVAGQAGAISHGIARALVLADETLRPALKREGLLTRDDRRKERKKAGLRGARARPQFSKR